MPLKKDKLYKKERVILAKIDACVYQLKNTQTENVSVCGGLSFHIIFENFKLNKNKSRSEKYKMLYEQKEKALLEALNIAIIHQPSHSPLYRAYSHAIMYLEKVVFDNEFNDKVIQAPKQNKI